ncbi:vWA domain-containing protein [Virgibacillus sp. W0181]|uniref:vWA domain-containing protein n=1 Tax=Virgibacillus sp. W0181 TaxID=3391581 RepID=UPI003F47B698
MDKQTTEIIFLLDRSGSMSGLEQDTIGGFNAFIEKQSQLPGKTILTTVLFDDRYEILWNGVDASKVKLSEKEYYVRGMTALLDAVGKTILDVRQRKIKKDRIAVPEKVIFVITTDGLENSSCEFSYQNVQELISEQQKDFNWEFIFMGANMDVAAEAESFGISKESAHIFDASSVGVEKMYESINERITYYRMDGNTYK